MDEFWKHYTKWKKPNTKRTNIQNRLETENKLEVNQWLEGKIGKCWLTVTQFGMMKKFCKQISVIAAQHGECNYTPLNCALKKSLRWQNFKYNFKNDIETHWIAQFLSAFLIVNYFWGRAQTGEGQRDRGRHRIRNGLWADSREPNAGLQLRNCEMIAWA